MQVNDINKVRKIRYDRLLIVIFGILLSLGLIFSLITFGINSYKEAKQKEAERIRAEKEAELLAEQEAKRQAEEALRLEKIASQLGNYELSVALNVRVKPSIDYEKATLNMIPEEYHKAITNSQIASGTIVKIIDIAEENDNLWGKLSDTAWICLKNKDSIYAIKKD